MNIEMLPPDEYSWARILVDREWVIICMPTIFGSTGVCLHRIDSDVLLCNWCAGNRPEDILYLVNALLGYLEARDEDLAPFCSRIKPYYQDEPFKAAIRRYHKVYICSIPELLASGTTNTY